MSELSFGTEEKTSPLKTILIVVFCVLLGGGAFWYMNSRTITALSVPKVQLYAAHTQTAASPGSVHEVGQLGESQDDLYVVATLRIHNNISLPVYLNSIDATYTAPDDSVIDTKAPSHSDLLRLEQIFPDILPLMVKPIDLNDGILPGATTEGTVLLHFSGLTAQTWKSRKSAVITLNFAHQPPETVTIP